MVLQDKRRAVRGGGSLNASLTDVVYDLLDHMEQEKAWMWVVVGVCLGLAPAVLFINLLLLRFVLRPTSPGILDLAIILGAVAAVVMILIGLKQMLFLRRWQRKLSEVKRAERKLYEEVIGRHEK